MHIIKHIRYALKCKFNTYCLEFKECFQIYNEIQAVIVAWYLLTEHYPVPKLSVLYASSANWC
jgi:hypothetical protein